jgi:exopolysaccharide production protein ExoY
VASWLLYSVRTHCITLSSINLRPVDVRIIRRESRFADVAERMAGLFLLVVTSPILIGSAAILWMRSGRSPFVAHLRVGREGEPFWMLKLRTMRGDNHYIVAEPEDDSKQAADPRIAGRFAAFCRRHSIDELPQLWHVVRGEMSLVGPRPLTRSEVDRYYGADAGELLSVNPGITGLWQVYGRSKVRFPQRSALDLQLVRSLTPRMYLNILLRTVFAFIHGEGAW